MLLLLFPTKNFIEMLRCILCFNPIIESRSFDTEEKHTGSLTVLDLINIHFGFTDENIGNYPNEKRMCKRCWISLSNFHELYCLVKTNYNSFPEEPVIPIIEVIETETEEEKLREVKNHKFIAKRAKQDKEIGEFANMKCDLCPNELFESFEIAIEHYKNVHNTKGYIKCCDGKYISRRKLVEHNLTHLNPDEFKCNICFKKFGSRQYLTQHRIMHFEKNISLKYECDHCSKSFIHKYQIKQHLFHNHVIQTLELTHQCAECPKKFKTVTTLKRHMKAVHSTENKGHICQICTQQFKSKVAVANHIKNFHEYSADEQRMHCTICNHYLRNLKSYKCHMKRHTDVQEIHTCTICQKELPNKEALREHTRYHQIKDKFTCKYCKKKSKRMIDHTDHENTHTTQYPHSCEFCTMKFRNISHRHRHRKHIHPVKYETIKPDYLKDNI